MKVEEFVEVLNSDFYAGVPDSQLKALCDFLSVKYDKQSSHHIIAANEGNAVALAAGFHLATGKIPVVYMQNSGEGNVINPVASLLNEDVYAIPCIFVIGWRGEPGVHDEPQHRFQGKITSGLMEIMNIPCFVLSKDTTKEQLQKQMESYQKMLETGKQVAIIVRKGALKYESDKNYSNDNSLRREQVINYIMQYSKEDIIVSTTGKTSRELFECREFAYQGHDKDFLTVGSMGHSSSIAMGIALQKTQQKVWCIDGDGAVLMHMGAMAVIGKEKVSNLIHIVINNGSHESVGGFPTAMCDFSISDVAKACGYELVLHVTNEDELEKALEQAKKNSCLCMIEVLCAIGSRENLGRPTTTPIENKEVFMKYLQK